MEVMTSHVRQVPLVTSSVVVVVERCGVLSYPGWLCVMVRRGGGGDETELARKKDTERAR